MQLSLKPYVTNGIVIAGAAALVAAPITISPPEVTPPIAAIERTIEVAPKALINDLLDGFADTMYGIGGTISHALYFVGSDPNFAAFWTKALAQNPALAPSILSAVITTELLGLADIPEPLITAITP